MFGIFIQFFRFAYCITQQVKQCMLLKYFPLDILVQNYIPHTEIHIKIRFFRKHKERERERERENPKVMIQIEEKKL